MESFNCPWPTKLEDTKKIMTQRYKYLYRRVENRLWDRSNALQNILGKENNLLLQQGIHKMRTDMSRDGLDDQLKYGELSNDPDSVKEWIVMPRADEEEKLKCILKDKLQIKLMDEIFKINDSLKQTVEHMTTLIRTKVEQHVDKYRKEQQQHVRNIIKTETNKSLEQLKLERYAIFKQEVEIQHKEIEKQATEKLARDKKDIKRQMSEASEKKIRETIHREKKDLDNAMKERLLAFIDQKVKKLYKMKEEMIKKHKESRLTEIKRQRVEMLEKQISNEMMELEKEMINKRKGAIYEAHKREMKEFEDALQRKKEKIVMLCKAI